MRILDINCFPFPMCSVDLFHYLFEASHFTVIWIRSLLNSDAFLNISSVISSIQFTLLHRVLFISRYIPA